MGVGIKLRSFRLCGSHFTDPAISLHLQIISFVKIIQEPLFHLKTNQQKAKDSFPNFEDITAFGEDTEKVHPSYKHKTQPMLKISPNHSPGGMARDN